MEFIRRINGISDVSSVGVPHILLMTWVVVGRRRARLLMIYVDYVCD